MGNNTISFPCRISARMLRGIDALATSQEDAATRQQVLQNMVNQFVMAPEFFDTSDVVELREPVTETIVVTVQKATGEALQNMAQEQDINLSALIRNIIYCGLRW